MKDPSMDDILKVVNKHTRSCRLVKVPIDSDDMWPDMLAFYKGPDKLAGTRLRVVLNDSPVVDTGGVRKQVYTTVFNQFVTNATVRLFEGPPNYVRPCYSPEDRCSGLFKVLGAMIGHSILQVGLGFPYLSPICCWYIVHSEEKALEYASIADIGQDTAVVIAKVYSYVLVSIICIFSIY